MTTLQHRSRSEHLGYQGRNAVQCPNCLKRFRPNSSGLAWHVSNVSECAAAWDAMPTDQEAWEQAVHKGIRRPAMKPKSADPAIDLRNRDMMNAIAPRRQDGVRA